MASARTRQTRSVAQAWPRVAHRVLEAFVGQWRAKGEIMLPDERHVRVTSDDSYEWLPGGFFLVHRFRAHLANGRISSGIEILEHDASCDRYLAHTFDSVGVSRTYDVTVCAGVWRFDSDDRRVRIVFVDDDTTRIVWERCDGATWMAFGELESQRIVIEM